MSKKPGKLEKTAQVASALSKICFAIVALLLLYAVLWIALRMAHVI